MCQLDSGLQARHYVVMSGMKRESGMKAEEKNESVVLWEILRGRWQIPGNLIVSRNGRGELRGESRAD